MTADELLQRIRSALVPGNRLDWRGIRDAIHVAADEAATPDARVTLLQLHQLLMDGVAAQLPAGDLAAFQTLRRQDYNMLVVRECLAGEDLSPALLDAITRREVAAGRMAPDDDLRRLAQAGAVFMQTSPPGARRRGRRAAFGRGRTGT